MRKIPFVLKFIIACVLGFLLQLTLHELGHATFAVIAGNKLADIHIGVISYAEIMVVNEWSVWIISIGAFVLPLIVCAVLAVWNCEFTGILSLVMLVATTIQLAINTVAIICVKDVATLQTYDLGICITSGGINYLIVFVLSLIVVVCLLGWAVNSFKKIAQMI